MLAAFTYRDFRVQWFGACTSSIGTWMQIVAQNWLVLSLTGFGRSSSASTRSCSSCRSSCSRSSAACSPIATIAGGRCWRRSTSRWRRRPRSRCSMYLRRRPDLAHPAAVVHHRLRAGVRRPGLSVAASRRSSTRRICRTPSRSTRSSSTSRACSARCSSPRRSPRSRKWGYSEPQAMNACFALNALSFLVVINTLMSLHVKHIPPAHTQAHARRAAGRPLATCATTAASSRSSCSRRRRRSSGLRC